MGYCHGLLAGTNGAHAGGNVVKMGIFSPPVETDVDRKIYYIDDAIKKNVQNVFYIR